MENLFKKAYALQEHCKKTRGKNKLCGNDCEYADICTDSIFHESDAPYSWKMEEPGKLKNENEKIMNVGWDGEGEEVEIYCPGCGETLDPESDDYFEQSNEPYFWCYRCGQKLRTRYGQECFEHENPKVIK